MPEQLDTAYLEKALVEVFPTYSARFEAARNLSLAAEADSDQIEIEMSLDNCFADHQHGTS